MRYFVFYWVTFAKKPPNHYNIVGYFYLLVFDFMKLTLEEKRSKLAMTG